MIGLSVITYDNPYFISGSNIDPIVHIVVNGFVISVGSEARESSDRMSEVSP